MKGIILSCFVFFFSLFSLAQRHNGILSFDGIDDYSSGSSAFLDESFSVDFYFRACAPSASIIETPLMSTLDTAAKTGFELSLTTAVSGNSASILLRAGDSSSIHDQVAIVPIYGHNSFHHIALSNDHLNNRLKLYFDGDSVGTLAINQVESDGLFLGTDREQSRHFQGQITELSIDDSLAFSAVYSLPTTYYFDAKKSFWAFDLGSTEFVSSLGDSLFSQNGLRSLVLPDYRVSGGTLRRDVCANGLVQMLDWSNFGSSMLWNDTTDVSLNGTQLELSGDSSRSYQVQFTDSNACMVDFTFEKTPVYPPLVSLGDDTVLCVGDTLTLSVGPISDSSFFAVWNDKVFGPKYEVRQSGEYRVKVGTASCYGSDTILVSDQAAPMPNLGSDTNLPSGFTVALSTMQAWNSFRWNTLETDSSILATVTGKYWVEVTDSNGCRGADTIFVAIEGSFPYSIHEDVFDALRVFPNPSFRSVEVEGLEEFRFELYDLNGKRLSEGAESPFTLPATQGVYILQLESEGKHQSLEILRLAP